jgi:hypothetical protein
VKRVTDRAVFGFQFSSPDLARTVCRRVGLKLGLMAVSLKIEK